MPVATLNPTAPAEEATLTRADRCDACGAQAFVEAINRDGLNLLFCGHHGRHHEPGLIAAGFALRDETHRINAQASTSSP